MAPEQAAGKAVDARSDVYSAGALLYTALTGQAPFDGDDATAVLSMVLTREPPPMRSINPNVPQALERIVERAMARNVGQRYATMAELDRALAPFDIGISPPTPPQEAPRSEDPKLRVVLASIILLTWVVLGAASALTTLVTIVNHGDVGWLETALVYGGCLIASAAPTVSYVLYLRRVVLPSALRASMLGAKLVPVALACVIAHALLALLTGTARTLRVLSPTFPSDLFVITGTLLAASATYVSVARRSTKTTNDA
jgi:hypothetical protein